MENTFTFACNSGSYDNTRIIIQRTFFIFYLESPAYDSSARTSGNPKFILTFLLQHFLPNHEVENSYSCPTTNITQVINS